MTRALSCPGLGNGMISIRMNRITLLPLSMVAHMFSFSNAMILIEALRLCNVGGYYCRRRCCEEPALEQTSQLHHLFDTN